MGRRSAPFSTFENQLKVVTDTDRVSRATAGRIGRLDVANRTGAEVIGCRTVRIGHINVLVATENARALAQIMDCANGKAVRLARRGSVDTAGVSFGHTALRHQRGVTP